MHFAKPCILLSALLAAVITLIGPLSAQERTITVDGRAREYILHVPKNLPPGPRPLVIALHGALQPASMMQRYLDLDAVADREGFIVAYPKGMNLLWNDGRSSIAGFIPLIYERDDAHFVLSVMETLEAEGRVDTSRAYLMGFSNGGFLTAFIACRYPDRFAAFATMMMTVPVGYSESCKPSRPVPILMMNGTYDPIVPMFGRPTPGARLMSADDSAKLFAKIDNCAPPTTTQAPGARITRWDQCSNGAVVRYYRIDGGHQPPSQSVDAMDALAAVILGPRSSGLDAPQEIWSFFKPYSLPTASAPVMAAATTNPRTAPVSSAPPVQILASASATAAPQAFAQEPDYAAAWRSALAPSAAAPEAPASVPLPPPSPLRQTSVASH